MQVFMLHQVTITVGLKEAVLNSQLLDTSTHDQQLESNPGHLDLQSKALSPWPRALVLILKCSQVLILKPVFNQLPGTLRKDAFDPVEDSCVYMVNLIASCKGKRQR